MQRLYGETTKLDSLVDSLVPSQGLMHDVDVHYTLRDRPGFKDSWILDIAYRAMTHDLPEYVVAYAVRGETSSLLSNCPSISTIFSFDHQEGAETAAANAMRDAGAVRFMVEDEDGKKFDRISDMTLERVPDDDYSNYNVPHLGSDNEKIVLLRGSIPNGEGRNVIYTTRNSGIVDSTSRFCFYYESRPSFVRQVAFDWNGMTTADAKTAQHHIIPFFMPKGNIPVVSKGDVRAEILIEQWLLPGQGVLLVW